MRVAISLVLLAAVCQAADVGTPRNKQKTENVSKTDKRALVEGNAGVEKRTPAISTVAPSVATGIEYADSKEALSDKSPAQQIYSTPVPQIAKISDVLTGQGPPFQSAIASHLYSPVSIYQARLASPTTYEVSAPIPMQLAYSEHKVSYQPHQNAIQFTPQVYNQKIQTPKQIIQKVPVNFQQAQPIFVQQQPIIYQQEAQLAPQQLYQSIPQLYQPQIQYQTQPVQYNQAPQVFTSQPSTYNQPLIQVVPKAQSGIEYLKEESPEEKHQQPAQRELKTTQPQQQILDKQTVAPSQNYNVQPNGAVSYASFSLGQPASSAQSQAQTQYQAQPQYHVQQYQIKPQYRVQQYQDQPQYQTQQYNSQPQHQAQPQYHLQQYNSKSESAVVNNEAAPSRVTPARQVAYLKPAPAFSPQPQLQQLISVQPLQHSQAYPQGQLFVQNGYSSQPLAVAPTFAPVQYFGKFAQSIFGGYQH